MKTILNHELAHQKYFEEITKIPHGSFHEDAIRSYLCDFAQEHKLDYSYDEKNNVIINKAASSGYENHPVLILQGHMDMVCEKNKDTIFDFEKDALDLTIEEGWLKAKGTTLGADDGVAIAYMLAILLDSKMKHPPLQCIFTVQEEVGLFGAMAIQKEDLHGKRLINLDDGGETSTCITSAGGVNVLLEKERILVPVHSNGYQLSLSGLSGGHSGEAIDQEKGNANKLCARILQEIDRRYGIQVESLQGGSKDNAIPREASATFVSDGKPDAIMECVKQMEKAIQSEYEFSDSGFQAVLQKASVQEAMSTIESETFLRLLCTLPNGMRHRSKNIEGLVTASSNIGVVQCEENIMINCSIRGAQESFIDEIADEVEILGEVFEYETRQEARYPAWSYSQDSKLRKCMQEVCKELYDRELELVAIHGGLECGIFKGLDEDMDIVTMGPIMKNIHTPQEALDLASFDRTFVFLKTMLERL